MVLDPKWQEAEKETDPDFEGSIHQQLGFDAELCPTCGTHLHNGICLNACHLSDEARRKFSALMSAVMGEGRMTTPEKRAAQVVTQWQENGVIPLTVSKFVSLEKLVTVAIRDAVAESLMEVANKLDMVAAVYKEYQTHPDILAKADILVASILTAEAKIIRARIHSQDIEEEEE